MPAVLYAGRPGTIDRLCGIFPFNFTFTMFHSSAIEEHEANRWKSAANTVRCTIS